MSHDDRPANEADLPLDEDGTTVLELFGMRLNVKNRRIAEVLTMDAGDALGADVRHFLDPDQVRNATETAGQAAPDIILTPQTTREAADSHVRAELRGRVEGIATALGFDVEPGGLWESPTGVSIVARVVDRDLSYAAAIDFVDKVASVLQERGGPDTSVLFVVDSQQSADVFKVAIKQRRLYDQVRTISLQNLESIRSLLTAGAIDHSRALVLLTPIANVDVGEVLAIIRAASHDKTLEVPDV